MTSPKFKSQFREHKDSHILIVDDDETLLKFFKIHLNKFFSHVLIADNAKDAMDIIQNKNVSLVISDIKMPKVDGLELLSIIKKHDPTIPVYIVSGAPLDDSAMKKIDKTADGFLKKPFSVDQIHSFISEGLKKTKM